MEKIVAGNLASLPIFSSISPLLATFIILSILDIVVFVGLYIYVYNNRDEIKWSDQTKEISFVLFGFFFIVVLAPATFGASLFFGLLLGVLVFGEFCANLFHDIIATEKVSKTIKTVLVLLFWVNISGGYVLYSSFITHNETKLEMAKEEQIPENTNVAFVEKEENTTDGTDKTGEKQDKGKISTDAKENSVENVENIIRNAGWIHKVNGIDDVFRNSSIAEKILVEHANILQSDDMPKKDISADTMTYKSKTENIIGIFVRVNGNVERILDASDVLKQGVDPSLEDIRITSGYFEDNFKNVKYIYIRTSDNSIVRGKVTLNLLDFSNIKKGDSMMMDGFILSFEKYGYREKSTKQEFWLVGYGNRNENGKNKVDLQTV